MNKFNLKEGQYILPPILIDSENKVSIETPWAIASEIQKGKPRLSLKAFYLSCIGSPILRKETKEREKSKGLIIFIPQVKYDWTIIQVQNILEKSAFGLPIKVEKGLIISYVEYCQEIYNKNLFFNQDVKKILVKEDLELPTFEDWMEHKEGYVSLYERKALKDNEKTFESLKDKLEEIKTQHLSKMETVKELINLIKEDLSTLEIDNDSINFSLEKIMKVLK